jgi:PAS domain S-box-containing protein
MTPDLWPVLPVGDSVYVGTRGGGLAILNLRNSYQKTPKIFIDNAIVEGNKAAVRVRPYAYWGDPQPHDIPIRYSIDNQKWTTWSNNHEVVLTDQTPGDHAIHVEAQNIFGEFELRGKLMYFSVPPPMQQMPQFYLPIGGLSFVLLFVLTEYFVRKKYYTRELQKSETKFRKLTESIFEGIVIHELDVIRDANNNMTRMFGYTIDELQRKSLYDLFDNDYIDVVKSMVEYPSLKSVEAMGIRSNGSRLWTEIVTTASVHPEYTYTVTAFRDISDRKNAEHKLVTYKNQLRSLASELTTTEERERRRIAAFLHDTISQTLAFCKIKLRSIDLSRQSESVEKSLIHVRSLIDEMIQSTRSLTFELSPPILYEVGFEAAVHSLIEQLQQQHNLSFVLIDDHISKPLDNESRIILYQAVRELIANVIKHAHANTVKITFKKENNMFRVTVEDDGVGMKTSTNSDESIHQGGFGLFNIRERLQTRGGSLEIITEIEHGTKISIVVPLRNHEK